MTSLDIAALVYVSIGLGFTFLLLRKFAQLILSEDVPGMPPLDLLLESGAWWRLGLFVIGLAVVLGMLWPVPAGIIILIEPPQKRG